MAIAFSIALSTFCLLAAVVSFMAISDAATRKWGDCMKAVIVGLFFIWLAGLAWAGIGAAGVSAIMHIAHKP